MNKEIAFLKSYLDKQLQIIGKLEQEVIHLDLRKYENQYVFSLKVQQLYTAIEDIFKQVAKVFENHIDDPSRYHRELLKRMNIHVADIRPAVISDETMAFLDRLRRFRHFIRHAYSFEFDTDELLLLQKKIASNMNLLAQDFRQFREFLKQI